MSKTGVLIAASVALAAVFAAGCTGPAPPSPVQAIPKILVDYQDNTTKLLLTSVNADVRYNNVTILLSNANNSTMLTFHDTDAFALIAQTNLTFFVINASADEGQTHYAYNSTWHIALAAGSQVGPDAVYQIYIRETADGPIQTESMPYRHLLAETAQ
jgi:hypothetical protein